jgi:hypothetical protein
VGLATEGHAAGAAVSAFHIALRYVDEPGHPDRIRTLPPQPAGSPYDRAMRRSRVSILSAAVAILALASCSSGTTNLGGPVRPVPTTQAPKTSSGVQIVSLTGPPSPPQCNAPTQVELHWVTRGATTVTLQINGGPVFARYSNGKHDELVPLACDGNPQTYLITARAGNGRTATKSVTVNVRKLSAS